MFDALFVLDQSPEVISASPDAITVKTGESVLLTCTATGTQPIEYRWLKDGKKIQLQGTHFN